ncbi:lytic transglycosylase domain-containing protein [Hydrogenimonas sp.]
MRRLALLSLLAGLLPLFGREITLEWLNQKPRSLAKDFYIWRYFDQNITPAQADAAFYQIKNVNWKLIHRYAKKTKMPGFAMADRCRRLGAKGLPAKEAACSAVAATPYKFAQMSPSSRRRLIDQLADYPELMDWMEPMAAQSPFFALIESGPKNFLMVFNRCGSKWRREHLDKPLPPPFLKRLAATPGFSQAIKLIATDPALKNLQTSLLGADAKALGHRGAFFLAMNAVRQGHPALARVYLAEAYKKAWFRFDKDKALFWFYLLDPKEETLRQLARSFDLNIYTLYAREKLGLPFPEVEVPAFKKKGCDYDIEDPFAWLQTLRALKRADTPALEKIARRFECRETLGHYAFAMERATKWRRHYFPIPYPESYEGLSPDDKALILALARQESRFIPASISSSYALGMMQIMPFLVKALAKECREPFDLDRMFDPYESVAYARDHLRFLKRSLHHPLFIAYAYNGGIGFTKRMLRDREVFKPGPYEPWLSMELVHYDESRRYGKKVLANYLVYKRLLGEPVSVESVVRKAVSDRRRGRPQNR